MVPHSQCRRIWQSAKMLVDCFLRRRREWGTMAATVGHLSHGINGCCSVCEVSFCKYILVLMTQSCRQTSWLIVACGGVRIKVSWWPWDDGSRHGWWVHGLASFHMGTLHGRCLPSIKSCQCGVFSIPTSEVEPCPLLPFYYDNSSW
jgi:hypothetical protein